MLKIYNAYANHGEIKIDDFIKFDHGRFDTGLDGFGEVRSGNTWCIRANYELQTLEDFKEYVKKVKVGDGWVQNFVFWRPMSYESLADEYRNVPRTEQDYERYGLNEEGILLFTNYVRLRSNNDNLTHRLFGRQVDTRLYLLMPNASISLTVNSFADEFKTENYEVLQSQSLGKQLVLAPMKRRNFYDKL